MLMMKTNKQTKKIKKIDDFGIWTQNMWVTSRYFVRRAKDSIKLDTPSLAENNRFSLI